MGKIEERDDLEHKFLEYKLNKVSNDVDLNLRAFRAEFRAEFEVINMRFDGVEVRFDKFDEFTEEAKTEIKKLKDDTAFVRDAKKWKWVVGLALIGLITTVNFKSIQEWIAKILPW